MPERPGAAESAVSLQREMLQTVLQSLLRLRPCLPGDASNTDIYTQAILLIKGNHHVFLSYLQATPDYEDVAALLK